MLFAMELQAIAVISLALGALVLLVTEKASFDAIFPDLAARHGAILYENFLAGLGTGQDLSAAQSLMQADGIHPNADGVARIVADIGPLVAELAARAQP